MPPGKIVADGRLQPETRGIAGPMTRFTVQTRDAGSRLTERSMTLWQRHPVKNERANVRANGR